MIERRNSVDTVAETKTKPSFVFVDNRSERLVTLRRAVKGDEPHVAGRPTEQEHTAVGRGLNYVRADFVDANADMGLLGLGVVDPTKFSDTEVAIVLQRCTSRQAMIEWGKRETRAHVADKIRARLAKPAVAPKPDEE